MSRRHADRQGTTKGGRAEPTPPCTPVGHDDNEECLVCDATGHHESCESREKAYDLADLLMRSPCNGCCPNGCKPTGLQKEQDEAAANVRGLFGR